MITIAAKRAAWRKASRKWYSRNRKKFIAIKNRWRLKNPNKTKIHRKNNYNRNRLKRIKYQKDWYKRNRRRARIQQMRDRRMNPEKYMVQSAKIRSAKSGVPFGITEADVKIPKNCPAIGIKLSIGIGKTTDGSPTIDRIIPHKGYVRGNICVISHKANRMKNNASCKEIIMLAEFVKTKTKGKMWSQLKST